MYRETQQEYERTADSGRNNSVEVPRPTMGAAKSAIRLFSMGPIMQSARVLLALCALLLLSGIVPAQMPFGSGTTVVKNATVFADGKIIENCNVLFAGKKIKAVGKSIKIPDDAETIDGKGRFIIPTLIDVSATLGLFDQPATSRTAKAHFSILDRVNLFDVAPFADAIEQGVTHVYLRNNPTKGVGGQGAGVVCPKKAGAARDDIVLKGSEAIHIKLGTSAGPIGRYLEVKGLNGQLLAAKKYRESWKKYDEQLKAYVKNLPKGKKAAGKKPAVKKDKPGTKPPKKKVDGPDPFHDEDDDHGIENDDHDHDDVDHEEEFDPAEIEDWDIWALGNIELHPAVIAQRAKAEAANHNEEVPDRWVPAEPQLRPANSLIDSDGTEPQLARLPEKQLNDPSGIEILVCEHCGGEIEGQPHFHPQAEGFDFWQFAPDPKKSASTKKKSSGKAAKKPKEPRFDPAKEALADVLEGKKRLRVEVHRAEDIKNLLKVLESHPMEVTLEGVTEGYMVAAELAKANVPVIVYGDVNKPIQETAGGGGGGGARPIPFPFPFPRAPRFPRGGAVARGGIPLEGQAVLDNAAQMAAKGVPVAIAASRSAKEATPQLLLAAGRVAGFGLDKAKALSGVTELPAKILGIDEKVGTLRKGKHASFVILDGDPFDASTNVSAIYIDGKRYYKKK